MRTIYLRNVPDEVAERLERLARSSGMSVNSFAVRELGQVAQRADNPDLLESLGDTLVNVDAIIEDLDGIRASR